MATISIQAFYDIAKQLEKDCNYVIWVTSQDYFEQIYLSPSFETVWGLPTETIFEDSTAMCDTLIEPHRAKWIRQLCERAPNEDRRVVNYIIERPDGELRYIQDRIYYLTNSQNQLIAIGGICQVLSKENWEREDANDTPHHFIEPVSQMAECFKTKLKIDLAAQTAPDTLSLKLSCLKKGYRITPREQQVLYYILIGKTAKEIGKACAISSRTVESYINSLKDKMGCTRKAELHRKLKPQDMTNLLRSLNCETVEI